MAWAATLWGRIAAGAALAVAVIGGGLLVLAGVRRRARAEERARITAAARQRELEDRRRADEIDLLVGGLSDGERRRWLRERWGRDPDGRL